MKKFLMSLMGFSLVLCLAFKNSKTYNEVSSSKKGEWGGWKTTSCYSGLDFRVRRTQEDSDFGGKYEWEVQFRNRYEDVINFNFKIVDPGSDEETGDRQSVSANSTSSGEDWSLITNPNRCEILVDKVRFGDDDAAKEYVECGH